MPVKKKIKPPEIEPVYEFVKGSGWVPSQAEWATKVVEGYRLTAIRRKPEVGEYYFSANTKAPAKLLEEITTDSYWLEGVKNLEERDYVFNKLHREDKSYFRRRKPNTFITLIFEACNGPE